MTSNVGRAPDASTSSSQKCPCVELAQENKKDIRTVLNAVMDVRMKQDDILKTQSQSQVEPTQNDDGHMEDEEYFLFALVSTKIGLDDLEESIASAERFNNLKGWLMKKVKASNAKSRMHRVLYLLFNRIFIVDCSWSGRGGNGPKVEFRKYSNILRLFAVVGGAGRALEDSIVEDFFIKKFKNSQSAAQAKGIVKSVSRGTFSRKKKKN